MRDLPHYLEEMIPRHFKAISNLNAVSPSLIKNLEVKYKLEKGKISWLPNVIDKLFETEQEFEEVNENKFVFLMFQFIIFHKINKYILLLLFCKKNTLFFIIYI